MDKLSDHEELSELFSSDQVFPQSEDPASDKFLKLVSKAKIKLILDLPFFGYLISYFKVIITDSPKIRKYTMDGSHIYLQLNYLKQIGDTSASEKQVRLDLIHLILHFVYQHNIRQKNYIPKLWNLASDIVVFQSLDQIIKDSPTLSDKRLFTSNIIDEEYLGKSTEKVYNLMLEMIEQEDKNLEPNQTKFDDNQEDRDYEVLLKHFNLGMQDLCDLDKIPYANDENNLTQQANIGLLSNMYQQFSEQGDIPAFLEQHLKSKFSSQINWKTELAIFLQNTIPTNTSWIHPNRKHISNNIYLPSQLKESLNLIIAIDTSQSIDDFTLSSFLSEVTEISSMLANCKIILVQIDMTIHSVTEYDYGETPFVDIVKGRGGTDFRPVFELIPKYDADLLIYFTDGEGVFPSTYSFEIPVLWALTKKNPVPFGFTIYL